jgi:aryl-alcohol dehydrogenase-like predicted oxidoreductase
MAHDFDSGNNLNRRDFLRAAGAGTALVGAGSMLEGRQTGRSQPLPQRELGKTGVKVPIIGLGTAPAGHRDRKEAAAFFGECLDAGVTYLDTAPELGGYGIAQRALGDVLKTRRKEAFLVTKCYEPDGEKALALLKKNLQELQTDRADVVYAHSIGADKMDLKTVLGKNGVMKALEKARDDGLTRFIGISGHNRPGKFLEVIREFEIDVMMNAVSYVSRHIYDFETKVWPAAHKRNIALVAMKVFGGMSGGSRQPKGGRLTADDLLPAFRYAQSLPNISTVVLGMHDREELQQNIAWARTYQPLSKNELKSLLAEGEKLAAQWGHVYGPVT